MGTVPLICNIGTSAEKLGDSLLHATGLGSHSTNSTTRGYVTFSLLGLLHLVTIMPLNPSKGSFEVSLQHYTTKGLTLLTLVNTEYDLAFSHDHENPVSI